MACTIAAMIHRDSSQIAERSANFALAARRREKTSLDAARRCARNFSGIAQSGADFLLLKTFADLPSPPQSPEIQL